MLNDRKRLRYVRIWLETQTTNFRTRVRHFGDKHLFKLKSGQLTIVWERK